MPVSKIQTGLRLDEELYSKLKTLSMQDGRSLNNLIEYIARQYVANYEAKNGSNPPYQDEL